MLKMHLTLCYMWEMTNLDPLGHSHVKMAKSPFSHLFGKTACTEMAELEQLKFKIKLDLTTTSCERKYKEQFLWLYVC